MLNVRGSFQHAIAPLPTWYCPDSAFSAQHFASLQLGSIETPFKPQRRRNAETDAEKHYTHHPLCAFFKLVV
jgi:hypothetical protein